MKALVGSEDLAPPPVAFSETGALPAEGTSPSVDSLICFPVSVLLFTFTAVTAPFLSCLVPTLFPGA
jgi:hypothetical protein